MFLHPFLLVLLYLPISVIYLTSLVNPWIMLCQKVINFLFFSFISSQIRLDCSRTWFGFCRLSLCSYNTSSSTCLVDSFLFYVDSARFGYSRTFNIEKFIEFQQTFFSTDDFSLEASKLLLPLSVIKFMVFVDIILSLLSSLVSSCLDLVYFCVLM